jgi:hypothetical protein
VARPRKPVVSRNLIQTRHLGTLTIPSGLVTPADDGVNR